LFYFKVLRLILFEHEVRFPVQRRQRTKEKIEPGLPKPIFDAIKTRGVSDCCLAIYIRKYLKAKKELWKLKYFTMHKYNLKKNPLEETSILQDIITL
jgi:hypothetical protein